MVACGDSDPHGLYRSDLDQSDAADPDSGTGAVEQPPPPPPAENTAPETGGKSGCDHDDHGDEDKDKAKGGC
jgi:hypothetical protein